MQNRGPVDEDEDDDDDDDDDDDNDDDDVLVSRPLLAPLVPVFFEVFRCFTPLRPLPFACFRFLRLGRDGSKSF